MGLSWSIAIAILLVCNLKCVSLHRCSSCGSLHTASASEAGLIGFHPVDLDSSGIVFTNPLDEFKGASNRVLFNGSGLALGDVDGDGWVDVFFCGIDAPNELYRNLGGWRFEKKPLPEALALPGFPSRAACWIDINEDARLDLLLTTVGGGTRAFIQQDGWQWIPAPDNAGLSLEGGAGSMALADVDGDGDVDLYVAYNRSDDIRDRGRVNLQRVGGQLKPSADLQDRILHIKVKFTNMEKWTSFMRMSTRDVSKPSLGPMETFELQANRWCHCPGIGG